MEPKAISTVEELRAHVVTRIDNILDSPFLTRILKPDDLRTLRAERAFWMNDDTTQLAKLLGLFSKEP